MIRHYLVTDYAEVAEWYRGRGLPAPTEDTLPRIGAIVPGVAVGFLYQTDSSVALFDGFVANAKAPVRERYAAIGAIVEALVTKAGALGFRHVVGMARSTGIAALVKRRQFRDIGRHVMLTREA